MTGRVRICTQIERFTPNGVIFAGTGEHEQVDAVVFATGYQFKFPFLPESVVKVEEGNRINLFKYMFPPHLPHPHTLAFIGLVQPLGPIMPMAELQARWAVNLLNNAVAANAKSESESSSLGHVLALPDSTAMLTDIEHKRNSSRFYVSARHTVSMDWLPTMDEYATLIGCRPNLWHYLLTDIKLWAKLLFGPANSYQYRLTGK